MPEIDVTEIGSRPATPPSEEVIKSAGHERKKSKIFVILNQLLHPDHEMEKTAHTTSQATGKIKHYQSKSLSALPTSSTKKTSSDFVSTQIPTPKPQIKMTQKILEFLHLKEKDGCGEELDVDISEDELEMLRETVPIIHDRHDLSFKLKYHFVGSKIIGKGASGVVRLAAGNVNSQENQRYAVKELRKRKKQESCGEYLKKLVREFRIAMLMRHENVVNTIDFVMIGDKWYEVMEYCSGGDLFAAIQKGKMEINEINCCFKQMVRGVKYLHEMGVSHRDLKPENLLIDAQGRIKITDFGVSEVFCDLEWFLGDVPSLKEKKTSSAESVIEAQVLEEEITKPVHKLKGLCGSCPYIAPEEFTCQEYDGRLVDVWSLGIIYYAMVFHCVPWEMAHPKNPNFKQYIEEGFEAFEPFSRLPSKPRALLKKILQADPAKRATIDDILNDDWFKEIKTCCDSETLLSPKDDSNSAPETFSYNCPDEEDAHCHQH